MRAKLRGVTAAFLCHMALVLVALAAVYPVVLRDQVPCDVDSTFFAPPWEDARPEGLEPAAGPGEVAQARRYVPWYAFLNDAARNRQPLLWNPLEGCGMPFLALWRTRCFSPFSFPFYCLPLGRALQLSVLLKLAVAGLCAYHAARKLGFAMPFALFVGVAFECSGHVYLLQGHPISDVVPWLPLLLVYAERLALGHARHWPLGALTVTFMAAGGDPEALAGGLLFVLAYLAMRLLLDRTKPASAVGSVFVLAASVLAGLALAAVQIVPFAEFAGQAASTGREGPASVLHLRELALCFMPDLLGAGGEGSTYAAKLLYIGALQVWLLALWFATRSFTPPAQRRRIEAMLLACCVMTLLALGAGRALAYVPGLALLGPEHLLVGNALVFAMMAAAAAAEWLVLDAEECKTALARLLLLVPVFLAIGALGVFLCRSAPYADAPGLATQIASTAGMSAALLVLLAVTLLRPSVRIMGCVLASLAFLSPFLAFHPALTYVDRDRLFPETPFVSALKDTGVRIGGSGAIEQWPLAGSLVPQVHCPSGVMLKRQAAFLERVAEDPLLLRRAGTPALLLAKQDIQGAFASIRPTLAIRRVFAAGAVLFDDRGAKSRAWLAHDWRHVAAFNASDLSAQLPPLIEGPDLPVSHEDPKARVTIEASGTNSSVLLEVEQTEPGVLVLADACYPGWRATVDGRDAGILTVDGLFRGVQVGPGKHEVEFRYEPSSVDLGRNISLAAAIVLLLGLCHLAIHRLRT